MNGIPDRVPIYAQMHEFAMKELGHAGPEFYTTPEILVKGSLEVMEKYGIDVPLIDYDVYNIEAEALGQNLVFPDQSTPDVDRSSPLIQDRKDLRKIKTPDFYSDGRFPQVVEMASTFRRLTDCEPWLEFCAPFSLAANIRGIDKLLLDTYADPDFSRELLHRLTEEVLIPWIQCLEEAFPDSRGISGADAFASLPIVNLEILEEWIVPYILRIREVCGDKVSVPNWAGEKHLKDPLVMLDIKRKVCPDFVEAQDPDIETLGPELYKDYAEKCNVPLVLGIGSHFLNQSTPEEIVDRVKYYLDVGSKNGRFALYLCNISASTPPENIRAATETVKIYGTYDSQST